MSRNEPRGERGPDPIARWLGDDNTPPERGAYRHVRSEAFLRELDAVISFNPDENNYRGAYAVSSGAYERGWRADERPTRSRLSDMHQAFMYAYGATTRVDQFSRFNAELSRFDAETVGNPPACDCPRCDQNLTLVNDATPTETSTCAVSAHYARRTAERSRLVATMNQHINENRRTVTGRITRMTGIDFGRGQGPLTRVADAVERLNEGLRSYELRRYALRELNDERDDDDDDDEVIE